MRAIVCLLLLSCGLLAHARPLRPARLIDPGSFAGLLAAVRAEPSSDGKLTQLRNVGAGRAFLFTAAQTIALLDCFEFWNDRLEALRLLRVVPGDGAAVSSRFDDAPDLVRSEARRILSREAA